MKSAAPASKRLVCHSTRLWPNTCGGMITYYSAAVQPQVQCLPPGIPASLMSPARVQQPYPLPTDVMLNVQLASLKPASPQQQTSCTPTGLKGFDDPQLAFSAKSTQQLLQSLAIFKACSIRPFVQHADTLLDTAVKLLGASFVTSVIRHSFYKQFCGGECEASTQHKLDMMRRSGVQPVCYTAAESDVSKSPTLALSAEEMSEGTSDHNLQGFLQNIRHASRNGGKPFTQTKITALGNCDMLKEASSHLLVAGRLRGHQVHDLHLALADCLDEQQLQQFHSMMQRMDTMCAAAHKVGVRLLIDAEYSYIQPMLDAVALRMQMKYNKDTAIIFNTYQCYLKDAHARILADMQHARQEGYVWAGKLVRGAYMHMERQRASSMGYPCPIHDTLQNTHASYNRCVEDVMQRVQEDDFEMMVASHNQASIEHAIALMQGLGIQPGSKHIHFGQLQGMADHLTYTLGANGYQAYKSVPCGPVEETIAYLVRRAKENSDVLGGVGKETSMLKTELWRRLKNNNAVARWLQQEPSHAAYNVAR